MRTRTALLAAATLLPLATLAACGGDSGGSSSATTPSTADVKVLAQDIHFDQKQYSATAGDVEFAYQLDGNQAHTLVIEDASGDKVADFKLRVAPGSDKVDVGTVNLPAGTYTMICDVPGHEAAGMKATLTVS